MPAQPQTLRKLADLQGHAETVWNLAWNPKKSLLASCSTDKDVRLYSYKKLSSGISGGSETVFRLEEVIPSGHKRTVRCVSWSPTGDILATSSFDSTVGLWEHIPDDIRSSMSAAQSRRTQFDDNGYRPAGGLRSPRNSADSGSLPVELPLHTVTRDKTMNIVIAGDLWLSCVTTDTSRSHEGGCRYARPRPSHPENSGSGADGAPDSGPTPGAAC